MAALDLASAGFGTAEGNAVQLGKALNDPIKGLSSLAKSGVSFTDDQKAMIEAMVEGGNVMGAQELILKAIETQVGGTSVATANGSDRMKVAFTQLMEFVGLKLLPVFERFVGFVVDKVVPVIQRMSEAAIPFLSEQFQKLRERLEPIIEQIGAFLFPIIEKVVDFVRNNTNTVKTFFAVLAGAAVLGMIAALVGAIVALFSPIVLIIGGLALLVAAFKHAYDNSETFRDVIAAAFDTVKVLIGIAMDAIRPIIQGLADTFEGVVRLVKGLVNGDFKEVVGGLKDIFLGMISTVIAQFLAMPRMMLGALRTGLSKIGTSLANFGKDLVGKIIGGITSAAGGIGSAILGAIPGAGAIGGLVGGVKKILPFAAGGIVTGPTLGLVGEAGPEAIIPLSQLSNVMGGSGVTVIVQGSVVTEGDLIETVRRGLIEAQRSGRQLVA
jgi:phage-related protein